MIRLSPMPPVAADIHRHGWPYIMDRMQVLLHERGKLADAASDSRTDTVLLEDFTEATFSYRCAQRPYTRSWVGIFHHPARIESPLGDDQSFLISEVFRTSKPFRDSLKYLRGAICLSPYVADTLTELLPEGIPLIVLRHPSPMQVPKWSHVSLNLEHPRLWQVGFFLRNPRAIFSIPTGFYRKARCRPHLRWMVQRDRAMLRRQLELHTLEAWEKCDDVMSADYVVDVPRLGNEMYDAFLASSVVACEIYGCAANNVVVECIARNTPIALNRMPELEYYLGREYPLFYENRDLKACGAMLADRERVQAASDYMADVPKNWLDVDAFCREVVSFTEKCYAA